VECNNFYKWELFLFFMNLEDGILEREGEVTGLVFSEERVSFKLDGGEPYFFDNKVNNVVLENGIYVSVEYVHSKKEPKKIENKLIKMNVHKKKGSYRLYSVEF